jgi:hypothetical protein
MGPLSFSSTTIHLPKQLNNMLKRFLFYTLFFILSAHLANAQAPGYAMVAASGTYTAIAGTTVPLTYNGTANNDDGIAVPASAVPIGFTFNYNGTNYTLIRPCANGFATFGTTALANGTDTWTNNITGSTATMRPMLAPLWDDLDMSGGSVTYALSGIAPARVLTIQWDKAKWTYAAANPVISFQLKLYETSNNIEFVYQQEAGAVTNTSTSDLGATIGISATATGTNTFLSLSDVSTSPAVSSTVETSTISTKPATGQVYRWIPFCTANATSTTGEKISNVTFGTINNPSTATTGYENFTTQSVTFQPSTSNNISITVSNATVNDQVYVWIDYNQNGSFDDAGELVFSSAAGVGPFTSSIAIPALSANVLKGRTRMRVRLQNNTAAPTNNTSCGSSSLGQVEDYTVDIQPCQPAAFTVQPANLVVCNGGGGTISATASGTGLTYQWQISTDGGGTFTNVTNTGIYNGATTNTLSLSGSSVGITGNRYRLVVNGTCTPAPLVSAASTLSVNTPGAITAQPSINTKVCVGSTATISAAASGSLPGFQWQVSKDGGITYSDVATGGTSQTLTISNATMADNGNRYRAVATIASCGSVVSDPTILTVSPLPVVTLSVAPVTEIKPGQSTFITAGSVPAAASYVWTRNGIVVNGATGSSINANINGLGTYQAIVTDVNGCTNKSKTEAVTALPSYDLFIYPNPSSGIFQVRLYQPSLTDWRTVRIFNSAGVLIASKEFPLFSNVDPYLKMDFDLSKAASGIYFVVLTHRLWTPTVAGKIIIRH